LNVNALFYCRPQEPYFSIMNFLAAESPHTIQPEDCETRTFLHDIPVVKRWEAAALAAGLKRRKAVIVPGRGVIAKGAWGLEQAFSIFSSVCFSTFVKFMTDALRERRTGRISPVREPILTQALAGTDIGAMPPALAAGPFTTETAVHSALCAAGRALVEMRLVDSNFGNVSYRLNNTLCISQTGVSLDELENGLAYCPLDDSACSAAIASSEFIAHRAIVTQAGVAAVLHGHPKYSVILSLFCEKSECSLRGNCHRSCLEPRFVGDVPIVPGEVGAGPFGLCHTLPPAILNKRGAIVYGHGLFTVGKVDFNEALRNLADIEKQCRAEYMRLGKLTC
jgi:ribulose-5-phosphate 4-epimerase/fuculose-1-phosphate aldolase